MRVNELDMSESTLLASFFRPVDYVTPLVFYSSYACRRPTKTGRTGWEEKTQPRNLLVIFVPLADLNPFAMPLCCHVVVVLLARSGCGWHWVQILAPLGVSQWSPSARSSFGIGIVWICSFFVGSPSRRRGLVLHKKFMTSPMPPIHIKIDANSMVGGSKFDDLFWGWNTC